MTAKRYTKIIRYSDTNYHPRELKRVLGDDYQAHYVTNRGQRIKYVIYVREDSKRMSLLDLLGLEP